MRVEMDMSRTKILPLLIGLACVASCSANDTDNQASAVNAADLEQNNVVFTSDAGLDVGAKVPLNITVKRNEVETTLGEILKDGPIILFFTRSVEWCGFCQVQLKNVNQIKDDIAKRGYRIWALSSDKPAVQQKFIDDQKIGFALLSDASSTLIDGFGLRDPQFTEGRAEGVPIATVMLIDTDGRIESKTVSGVHDIRPTNTEILEFIDSK